MIQCSSEISEKNDLQFGKLYSQPNPQMVGEVLELNFDAIRNYFLKVYACYSI